MQFLTALFGGSDNTLLNAGFALGIVLILIVLGVWTLKYLSEAGQRVGRGKTRRLQVIDSAQVDGKRKVVIIRRDNIEHVLLTGGPQDLVIETGLIAPAPPQQRRPASARNNRRTRQPEMEDSQNGDYEDSVPRETVDLLRDLARPEPLKPRTSLRHTALVRPVERSNPGVIPMPPNGRVDKSGG
jgi:flagellar protein FliO/FliZ